MPTTRKSRRHKRRSFKPSPLLKIILAGAGVAALLAVSGFTFAASRETHDSFCASCHTQPESTFYQRSITNPPVDLASAHKAEQTRCIDCHSGIGVFGRMGAELLGAHNALAFYTRTAVQPAVLTKSIGDANCLKCHQDVTAQAPEINNHFHVFLFRWQAADPNAAHCVSCHGGHTTEGSADTRFMSDATVRPQCEACHQALGEGG